MSDRNHHNHLKHYTAFNDDDDDDDDEDDGAAVWNRWDSIILEKSRTTVANDLTTNTVLQRQSESEILPGLTVDDDFIQQQIAILKDLERKMAAAASTSSTCRIKHTQEEVMRTKTTSSCCPPLTKSSKDALYVEMGRSQPATYSTGMMNTTPHKNAKNNHGSNRDSQQRPLIRLAEEEFERNFNRDHAILGGDNGGYAAARQSTRRHRLLLSQALPSFDIDYEGDLHNDDDEDSFIKQQKAILDQFEREATCDRRLAVTSSHDGAACFPASMNDNTCDQQDSPLSPTSFAPCEHDADDDCKPTASDMIPILKEYNDDNYDNEHYDDLDIIRQQQEIYETIQKEVARTRRMQQLYANESHCQESTSTTQGPSASSLMNGSREDVVINKDSKKQQDSLITRSRQQEKRSTAVANDDKVAILSSGSQEFGFKLTKDHDLTLQGGRRLKLKGTSHVLKAISDGTAMLAQCPSCRTIFQIPHSCQALYCSFCRQVSHIDLCRVLAEQDGICDEEEDANIALAVHQQEMYACKLTKLCKQRSH